jgi:hypothetical protein
MPLKPQVEDKATFDAKTEGAERVEIKVTVLEKEEAKAIEALDLDTAKAQGRSIYFFDTPKLDLYRAGVVLRARQIEGEHDDSTVKIRPVDPRTVNQEWFEVEGFKLEADAVGDKVVRSASLTAEQGEDEIQEVFQRKRAISKLYSPDQERLLAAFHPKAVDLDGLAVMGPIPALRQDVQHAGVTYKVTAECWRLPDGSDLVELSIKCSREEAAVARKIFEGFLVGLGLDPHGSQETKTKRALTCFAKRVKAH